MTGHWCADCGRTPRDGVTLRELRLLTDPPGTIKHLCADQDADHCAKIVRQRRTTRRGLR